MEMRFVGKTVIVTGSSSGIGEGCARRFAAEGANVVLVARSQETLDNVARSLEPERTLAVVADVSDRKQVARMIAATVERFGGINVLHNNAGMLVAKDFEEITEEDWRATMATNIDGYFHCVQLALPHLKISQGCIVQTASVSGIGGDWGLSAYDASKGAVVNFTRALALDLGKYGVRVNAVAPSLTQSHMTEDMLADETLVAKFLGRIALGRYATADDRGTGRISGFRRCAFRYRCHSSGRWRCLGVERSAGTIGLRLFMTTRTKTDIDDMLVLSAGELDLAVLGELVPRLGTSSTPVTVLVSSKSTSSPNDVQRRSMAELASLGVDLLFADLATLSQAELAKQFARFKTIVNCTGFVAGPGTQLKITGAALDAGVPRYFPWQFGVDYDVVG